MSDPDFKFTIGHLFCGIGGKGLGAAQASVSLAGFSAVFETVGGIDFQPAACRDFQMLVKAPALCADLHELQPAQLRAAWGDRAPDVVMSSPPCKGFSGLLGAKVAAQPKYQEMNRLILKATMLLCSTWDQPPPILFFENVPRIQGKGAELVAQVITILTAHGYAVDTGNHDCGEIGELAQHRQRWFLLARHKKQLQRVIYVPHAGRVKSCGEVIGPLPMPNDPASGPMHELPKIHWRNWRRLARIPAGGDWRDIPAVADPRIDDDVSPSNGAGSVADPRFSEGKKKNWQQVSGVTAWDKPAPTITSNAGLHAGAFQVADPRLHRAMSEWRLMSLKQALELDLNPNKAPPFVPVIVAEDGTWHRPFTTLECAVLQSFPTHVDGKPLVLDGTSHTRWREGIGNAVPPAAGRSVANQLLFALLAAKTGAFSASVEEVWVDSIRDMMA